MNERLRNVALVTLLSISPVRDAVAQAAPEQNVFQDRENFQEKYLDKEADLNVGDIDQLVDLFTDQINGETYKELARYLTELKGSNIDAQKLSVTKLLHPTLQDQLGNFTQGYNGESYSILVRNIPGSDDHQKDSLQLYINKKYGITQLSFRVFDGKIRALGDLSSYQTGLTTEQLNNLARTSFKNISGLRVFNFEDMRGQMPADAKNGPYNIQSTSRGEHGKVTRAIDFSGYTTVVIENEDD